MPDRPPKLMFPGIAAAAGAVLMLEIGLTRIFSYTIWYHFAYLTISVALLGFGASGAVLAAFPRLRERRGFLSWWAIAAQAGVFLCLLVVDQVALDPLAIASEPGQFGRLLLYYVAVAVPFFAAGFLVAAPLQRFPGSVSRLYFWDLVGAGLACGSIVPLIWWVGTPAATALSTVALAFAAWAYAEPGIRLRQTAIAGVVAVGTLLFSTTSSFTPAPTKFVSQFLANPGAKLAYSRWTPINRVDVVAFDPLPRTGSYIGWGISPKYRGSAPGYYMIGNDGDSCAVMYNWDGDLASIDFLTHHILRVPYLLLDEPDVVAIGLGGGADVLNALNNRAKSVVGVEINPMTVRAGRELFNDFNGDILNRPGVEAVVAEGRSFLRSRDTRYDLVEINSVDTLSALSTGAYVLSESFLYTADAVDDYLEHLEPKGIFAMAVGDLMSDQQQPRHTLRLASIVRKALENRGVAEPARHVMVVGTGGGLPFTHTLVRNEPFTAAEVERVARFLHEEGFDFWHRPDRPMPTLTSRILSWDHATLEGFYARHDLNLEATTDASPFFFNFYKWRTLAKGAAYDDARLRPHARHGPDRAGDHAAAVDRLRGRADPAAAAPGAPGERRKLAAAAGLPGLLRGARHRLHPARDQLHPALRALPRLSDLLAHGRDALAAGLHRGREPADRAHPGALCRGASAAARHPAGAGGGLPARDAAGLRRAAGQRRSPLRVAVSIALLVPLGLVLGSFFPLGIRLAERVNPRLVPWAWAVNGCATVIGTLLAVMAGMTWSFTAVALAAMGIYALGVLGLYRTERRAPA